MRSWWLTFVTVASLMGAYQVYSVIVAPLTQVQIKVDGEIRSGSVPEIKPLSIAGRIAHEHLADHDWVAEAKYQLQRGEETFIYFRSQKRIEDDKQNRIRVSPFAMVWIDPKRSEGAAYTLYAESAVIWFQSKLQFGMSSPGRIIGGELDGAVQIRGPDGLLIEGQYFQFSEEALRLHSDHPVQFAFGPQPGKLEQVRGQAERIDIRLKEATGTLLGQDMPRVGGMQQVTLGRNVVLDLVMDDRNKPAPVRIQCKTAFKYDVDQKIATFVDDVRVRRATHQPGEAEQYDRLQCDRMQLVFEEASEAPAEHPAIAQVSAESRNVKHRDEVALDLDLELASLRAIGDDLKVGSDENDLFARMQDLFYDLPTRTLEMRNPEGNVEARYRSDLLTSPFILVQHDDDSQVEVAECHGTGRVIRHDPESGTVQVDASWRDHLIMTPDVAAGLSVLTIAGEGRVLQPPQQTGIVADTLTVWLDAAAARAMTDNDPPGSSAEVSTQVPLRKVVANSNVALVSPRLHLETQTLEVTFVAGTVPERTASPLAGSRDETTDSAERDAESQPVVVGADRVVAELVYDPVTKKTDVVEVTADDGVTISRAAADTDASTDSSDAPFSIEAETLELRNQDGNHVLKLLGRPARIRHPEAEIEGGELYFDRAGNLAVVRGEGALSILVDSDLQGRELDVAEPLSVRWVEQMRFDGGQATFLGNVRTTLADSKMRCERMTISLSRTLEFDQSRPSTDGLEIDRIQCQEGVRGEYTEWEGTTLIGIRQLEVAEFAFERSSGNITALGPGHLNDWRHGGERRRVILDPNSARTAKAKSSKVQSPKWEYTRVDFAGILSGNERDSYVKLEDRVRVMHGPVLNPLDTIDREEFALETPQAKNSIWIGSDTLQVRLVPGEEGTPDTVSVLANGNAELQGKVLGARADSISFDESKEMFTLKGRGSEAYLWHQEHPGDSPREMSAKTIQFVPSRREITIDGTRGIQGAP